MNIIFYRIADIILSSIFIEPRNFVGYKKYKYASLRIIGIIFMSSSDGILTRKEFRNHHILLFILFYDVQKKHR